MAIAVQCKCGRHLKLKDHLAGKAVRCPDCGQPIRVPSGATAHAGVPKAPHAAAPPAVDEQAALLKFEQAQKRKLDTAEAEAAYRAEQKKLLESYEQLTGKKDKLKKAVKNEKAGEAKPRNRTAPVKVADAIGAVCGTLAFKYVVIAILLAGGVTGSTFLVKYITSYMHEETAGPAKPAEERAKELLKEADTAIKEKRWQQARKLLAEVVRLDPRKEMHRDYQRMRKILEKAPM